MQNLEFRHKPEFNNYKQEHLIRCFRFLMLPLLSGSLIRADVRHQSSDFQPPIFSASLREMRIAQKSAPHMVQ